MKKLTRQLTKLADCVVIIKNNEYAPIKNNVKKYVAGGHIKSRKLFVTDFGNVEEDQEVIGSSFISLFQKGDILFKTREPNAAAIATFDGLCANTTLVLQTKQNSDLIDGLLPFILESDKFKEYIIMKSVGSTNLRVRWKDLEDFEIDLPSKSIQEKFHDLLWSIQTSIDDTENLMKSISELFRNTREQLLFSGINKNDLEPINWYFGKQKKIPKDWKVMTLGNILQSIQYGVSSKLSISKGIPILRMQNIVDEKIEPNPLKYLELDKQTLKTFQLEKGDILFNRTNTIDLVGKTGLFTLEGVYTFASYLLRLKVDPKLVIPEFLNHVMNSFAQKSRIKSMATRGVSQSNVNPTNLKKLIVPLPSIPEQKMIDDKLNEIINLMNPIKNYKESLYSLRRSVSQSFFMENFE